MADIDSVHEQRLQAVHDRYWESDAKLNAGEVFTSRRVIDTLESDKVFLNSFHQGPDALLGLLPFSPIVYSFICPLCVQEKNFNAFTSLVKAGLLIPVLRAPYSKYSDKVRDFILAHDHMSMYEYLFFRFHSVYGFGVTEKIHIEMHRMQADALSAVVGHRSETQLRESVQRLYSALRPPIDSDYELYRRIANAANKRKLSQLKQLERLVDGLYRFRSAQVFNASVVFHQSDLEKLPANVTPEADATRRISTELKEIAAGGLGIRIPTDLPIETYIELVKDYQPQIAKNISAVLPGIESAAVGNLLKNMSALNNEIERIKGLKRYAFLEACVAHFKNNGLLLGGALLATTMGLAGNFLGCATIGAAAAAGKIVKGKGWIKENPALRRLGRMIARDVQPYTNALLRGYLRGSTPAINVLSLQRRIRAVSGKKINAA